MLDVNFPAEYRQKKLVVQGRREDKALAAQQRLEESNEVRNLKSRVLLVPSSLFT